MEKATDLETLRAILEARDGVGLASRDDCITVARRLKNHRRIGLLPSSKEVGVTGVTLQLAKSFVELYDSPVGVVDANRRWPGVASLVGEVPISFSPCFGEVWIEPQVALLVPNATTKTGAGVFQLANMVEESRFSHMLCDLTGFWQLGEHLAAASLLDGVLIVGRAGHTRENDLLRLSDEITPSRNLGVLLVG